MHAYDVNGSYLVQFTVTDDHNHTRSVTLPVWVGDETAPSTSLTVSGRKGENNWFTGASVMLRLTAVDDISGVDTIMYTLDGQGYQPYTHSIVLYSKGREGMHTISYYSVDKVGNREDEKTSSFGIDVTDPGLTIEKPKKWYLYIFGIGLPLYLNNTVVIGPLRALASVNESGSGVNRTEFYLNDQLVTVDTTVPYTCMIGGFSQGGGAVELKVVTYDFSGRNSTKSLSFVSYGFGVLSR